MGREKYAEVTRLAQDSLRLFHRLTTKEDEETVLQQKLTLH